MTSVDLFAGCGGLTRGLEWTGFECVAFNEINKDAADSFAINFPNAVRLDGDIREAMSDAIIDSDILPIIGTDIDLVCGGPPCQGYSGIGHRRTHHTEKRDIPANQLFQEMIRVIEKLQPKAFLFENVQGILSGRWDKEGKKGEIFRDVWSAFSSMDGYVAQPTLLHAYGFGVPQNRPRVMILGVKEEIARRNSLSITEFDPDLTISSYHSQLRNNGGLFPMWNGSTAPDLIDVLGDLDFEGWIPERPFHRKKPKTDYQRLMRSGLGDNWRKHRLTDHEFSNHTKRIVEKFEAMHNNGGKVPEHLKTKKFNQRVVPRRWGESVPSITATSLPDDYIHYARPRTFSVREWARIQSFPDYHLFSGNRTTGGSRRAGIPSEGIWDREVPKYTQVGNAVPPLLAKAIGDQIASLLH
jgi:DNA (cytosine-5)-methyltransferase 1